MQGTGRRDEGGAPGAEWPLHEAVARAGRRGMRSRSRLMRRAGRRLARRAVPTVRAFREAVRLVLDGWTRQAGIGTAGR